MVDVGHSAPCAACCDIGGTKALIGFVDREGNVLVRDRYLPAGLCEPAQLIGELAARLRSLASEAGIAWSQVAGMGYSTAGMMDVESGIIFASPNQGAWRHVPFRTMLREALAVPAWIEMDANAAALGEAWKGAGVGVEHLAYVVVGTGIGSGILVRGEVHRGWRGTAGEIGHTTIEPDGPLCNCGNYGCLEALAAGPAITLQAQGAILQGRRTLIAGLAAGQGITAEMVTQAARHGDAVAREILARTAGYLGIGLANLITLLSPEVIALGGGVMRGASDLLLEPIRRAVAARCGSWVDLESRRIVLSALGEEAGLLGAARVVWDGLAQRPWINA
jgi:glucokinase